VIHKRLESYEAAKAAAAEKIQRYDNFCYSMIKFFVLDVLLRQVVAVSSDPAPDSAFAPPFFGRPSGQLP
jgi:hypothetical protein